MKRQRHIRVNLPLRKAPPWTVGVTATKGRETPLNEADSGCPNIAVRRIHGDYCRRDSDRGGNCAQAQIPGLSSGWFCRQYGTP